MIRSPVTQALRGAFTSSQYVVSYVVAHCAASLGPELVSSQVELQSVWKYSSGRLYIQLPTEPQQCLLATVSTLHALISRIGPFQDDAVATLSVFDVGPIKCHACRQLSKRARLRGRCSGSSFDRQSFLRNLGLSSEEHHVPTISCQLL